MMKKIFLKEIAHTRSGDKGNSANIGVIAHDTVGFRLLQRYLTEEVVKSYLKPLAPFEVVRYELPNLSAFNFVLKGILGEGGGNCSLRLDAQGKSLGTLLLDMSLEIEEGEQTALEKFVKVEADLPGLCVVSLNRPAKRNAIDCELAKELIAALERLSLEGARVVILKGEGPVFCSGMDLTEATDPVKSEESAALIGRLLKTLYHAPFVTIAAVQGAAIALGAGFVTACDFAIAEQGAKFGYPEVKRGLVAAQVMPLLKRLVGVRRSEALFLTGELIMAEEAERIGLVSQVVPQGALMDAAKVVAEKVLAGAPEAVASTKRLFRLLDATLLDKEWELAFCFHQASRRSGEAKQRVSQFLNQ